MNIARLWLRLTRPRREAEAGYRWSVLRCTETGERGWYQIPESAKSGDVLYPGEWQ